MTPALLLACAGELAPEGPSREPVALPARCDSPPREGSTVDWLEMALPTREAPPSRGFRCGNDPPSRAYVLHGPVVLQGVTCTDEFSWEGRGESAEAACTLREAACLDGLPLRQGPVRWNVATGEITQGILTEPAGIAGVRCGVGPFVVPADGTGYCTVDGPVQGFPCIGVAQFTRDGLLRDCKLTRPTAIPAYRLPDRVDALACTGNVSFAEDGDLERCTLATPGVVDGLDLPAGTSVWWSKGRLNLQRERVKSEVSVDGCARGIGKSPAIWLYPTGGLAECELAEAREIDGVGLPVSAHVELDPMGHLERVDNVGEIVVEGVRCSRQVWFGPGGRLSHCKVAEDTVVGRRTIRAGQTLRRE